MNMSAKSSASSSPCSSKDNSPGKVEFVVGNRIEAMDYLCNWYVSKIAKVDHKKKKILIHFEGWNQRYDEWVSFDSKKIRALPKERIISKSKPKEHKEWREGDIVSAKWTDGTYYPAGIVKVISKDFYEVEYDDGFQKIIHQSKIREYDATNKLKKPSSSGRNTQKPGRKAKLAEDRASRARRRSVKDRSVLSPQSSEATEQMEERKEMKVEGNKQEIEKKEVGDEKSELKSEDLPKSLSKPQRHDSDVSQESKPLNTELTTENDEKMRDLEATSPAAVAENTNQSKTETAVSLASQPSDSKPSEAIEPQNKTTPKTSAIIPEKLKTPSPDEVQANENTIRVTHIKENPKNVSECVKRSVTSPLSVEVDPRTDIRQVIIPDKDMNILQSTGVLGLLNVQEPCVILGTTLAGASTTTSAAEEVLSKCNIPTRVTTELKTSENNEEKILEEIYILERAEISKKKLDDLRAKVKNTTASLDNRGSVGTSMDTQKAEVDEPSGVKQDIEGDIGKDKDMTGLELTKSIPKQVEKIRMEKDESLSKAEEASFERDDVSSVEALDEIEDVIEHAQKSEDASEHAQKPDDVTEHAQKSEEATKSKPQASGADSFKAKRLRLDQITGKLSIQRQTQITAKREVIKQKLDHLKTEEITKSTHVPPSYQQMPPNPPPYPQAPTTRITPQYVDRYPAPTLLTYGAPTQCTGPCCTYPPGSSYTPASAAGYHITPGGLPRETYVVYGPGTQASFPVIAPTISPAPCSCCSLYSTAVLHEAGQTHGPPMVRLMQVDQRPLSASLVYTASHPAIGERPKISPRGLSPRGISPKGISPEGRKPGRAHMSKKVEQESGTKHKDSGKQDKASYEGKQGIRYEESTSKKAMPTASKLSRDVKSDQYKPSDNTLSDGINPTHTHHHPHTSHIHHLTSTKVNPKSFHGTAIDPSTTPTDPSTTPIDTSTTPTDTSTAPNAPDVNLSKHLSAHITSPDTPQNTTPIKRQPPSHLALDPDDIPLSRLVSTSTPGETTPGDPKTPRAIIPEVITPVGDSPMDQLMSTPLPADSYPGKILRRPHVFAPKELRIELDHNKYKCQHPDCDKSFRKASLLESHVKYYHASPPDNKRKRSSASGSEEDWYESSYPKKRTKRQSTSDVSIGSVGDISVDAQSPTASDIHVEVEHDLDDEMDVDMSEHKEEDVVRCLCGVREDSGLMIQCEQCYTWQHSDCVHVGQDHVPAKYFCYVCRNPPGLRKNARYKNNYDWFKTGVLPSFVPHEEHEVKIVQAQVTHCLLSDLHSLNSQLKGMKRKVHILRTPNHAELKMWEHKHEVCEDDSLTTTEGESSRNDSSVSEKETGMIEEKFTEEKMQENVFQSENFPRDESNTRVGDNARGTREARGNDVTESDMRGEDHTRGTRETHGTRETCGNYVTDARNGKSVEDKDQSETKSSVSNEGIIENREVRNNEEQITSNSVSESSNELAHEGRDGLNNGGVEDNKEIETSEQRHRESTRLYIDKAREEEQTTRVSDSLPRDVKETSRFSGDQARSGQEIARMNDIQTRKVIEAPRVSDIQARDGKESARINDIQPRGAEETRNAQETARSMKDAMENLDNNQEVESCDDLGEKTDVRFDEAKMKYSGEDLAFVNLLEEIEEDQTLFDEQLDKLEKQVEILEKSLLIGGTTERRPTIRKLAKQLSKLQKLGFVC